MICFSSVSKSDRVVSYSGVLRCTRMFREKQKQIAQKEAFNSVLNALSLRGVDFCQTNSNVVW